MKPTHKLPDGRLVCKRGKWWFVHRNGLWWPVSGDLSEIYQLEKVKWQQSTKKKNARRL